MKTAALLLAVSSVTLHSCEAEPHPLVHLFVGRFDAEACSNAVLLRGGGRSGRNGHEAFRNYSADKDCVNELIAEMEQIGFGQLDDKTYVRRPENDTREQVMIKSEPLSLNFEIEWIEWGFDT